MTFLTERKGFELSLQQTNLHLGYLAKYPGVEEGRM
jgi:hypothetical protein